MSTDDSTQAYDPADDPDTDPEMLNPRTGAEASGEEDATDPDADPANLNPRTGGAGGADTP
jgi:hypothetical protein